MYLKYINKCCLNFKRYFRLKALVSLIYTVYYWVLYLIYLCS